MRNLLTTSLILILGITIFSCSKDDLVTSKTILNSISPESGKKGTVVSINGTNFGTNQDALSVSFNDKPALIQSVTDTVITAIVPSGALTGLVKVIVAGIELTGPEFSYVVTVEISTLAGGTRGFADGIGKTARFSFPFGITTDSFRNIYVADWANHRIRKITPDGTVSTIAGNGLKGNQDGAGINATFSGVDGLATDKFENIYITEREVGRVRRISANNGMVSTIATGLTYPEGIVVDDSGNIYVGDLNKLLKIDPNGTISILAGGDDAGFTDGIGTDAKFNNLTSLAIDASGIIYATDGSNHRIRRITPNGEVGTVAGSTRGFADGAAVSAQFDYPTGITVDLEGNLFVVDYYNDSIRKITPDGQVSTLVDSNTPGFDEGDETNILETITIDVDGNLYITDSKNHNIRKITFE